MDASWRPPGWLQLDHLINPGFEEGASAIIPFVEAEARRETLREVGIFLNKHKRELIVGQDLALCAGNELKATISEITFPWLIFRDFMAALEHGQMPPKEGG